MLKNSPETIKTRESESKKDFNQIVKDSLELELQKMKDRNPERSDIKFRVLKRFATELSSQPFKVVYNRLGKSHKHAIITRLENQAEHMGGDVPYDFIKSLEQELYGITQNEKGEQNIDFEKKMELEKQLQSEN